MSFSARFALLLCSVSGLFLFAVAFPASAQTIVAVHGLQVGQCVQVTDFSGVHKGVVAQAEYAGGYQVTFKGITTAVGANSSEIAPCAPAVAPPVARPAAKQVRPLVAPTRPTALATAPATAREFKVGDCVQFSYGGGWETATIAKPAVAGAYQVNWGSIVVPASADPKNIRACPAGVTAIGQDAATKAAMAKLPKSGLGAPYGTRAPAICANRKVAITPATAKALVACQAEGVLGDTLYLTSDMTVQVGAPRAYNPMQDSAATGIDPAKPVYDLRGSYTRYQCTLLSEEPNDFAKTHNCLKYPATAGGYGRCYTDTSGDKQCIMTGGGPTQLKNQPPPPAH